MQGLDDDPDILTLTCLLGSFCGQNEEDDPSEDYEEYLACSVCGDHGKSNSNFLSYQKYHMLHYQHTTSNTSKVSKGLGLLMFLQPTSNAPGPLARLGPKKVR